ncbi:MAG: hypothetical protein R8G66_16415 [Cytophagales bacterium]|nr:hypothetical protein [Cytophagales bacterium]
MSSEQDHIELFDRISQGQATSEERDAFGKQLASDNEFARDYEAYKVGRRALDIEGFITDIGEVRGGEQRKKSILVRLIPIGIAASILLGVVIFNRNQSPSHLALFEEHFSPYPYLFQDRTGSASQSDEAAAVNKYQNGKYEEALSLFPVIVKNDTTLFFKGLSFLGLQQADSALQLFDQLPKTNFILNEEVRWYKGLAYLLLQEEDSAIFYLQSIPVSSQHQPDAEAITQELRK